jgi:hypothetical protein
MKRNLLMVTSGAALLLVLTGLSLRARSAASVIAADLPMKTSDVASIAVGSAAPLRIAIKSTTRHIDIVSVTSPQSNSPAARFERARVCHEAANNKRNFELQVKGCEGVDDEEYVDRCLERTAGFDKNISVADQILAQCSPVPAELEEDFYRTSIEAAKAGDATAQLCYLESDVNLNRPFRNDEVDYYHSVDAEYVNDALKRGDWRMVELMSRTYRDSPHHSTMRRELTNGDPYTLYQMNRLLSLGADGEYKGLVEFAAERAKERLTAKQIQQADDWVGWIYEKHFAASPRMTEAPATCESH